MTDGPWTILVDAFGGVHVETGPANMAPEALVAELDRRTLARFDSHAEGLTVRRFQRSSLAGERYRFLGK